MALKQLVPEVKANKTRKKTGYRIRIRARSMPIFVSLVQCHMIPSIMYKLGK